jgi:hypothetical protein
MRLGGKKGTPQSRPPPSRNFRNAGETEDVPSGAPAQSLVEHDEEIPLERQKNAKRPARGGKTCSARSSHGTKVYGLILARFGAEQRLKTEPSANLLSFVQMIRLEMFGIDCLSWFSEAVEFGTPPTSAQIHCRNYAYRYFPNPGETAQQENKQSSGAAHVAFWPRRKTDG